MKVFTQPKIGSTITVTIRLQDYYYYSKSKWKEITHTNIKVLEREPWFKKGDFKIPSNIPQLPFFVINIKNVSSLLLGDSSIGQQEVASSIKIIEVPGSDNNVYLVTVEDGTPISCTCPHHVYRRAYCKHMQANEG